MGVSGGPTVAFECARIHIREPGRHVGGRKLEIACQRCEIRSRTHIQPCDAWFRFGAEMLEKARCQYERAGFSDMGFTTG